MAELVYPINEFLHFHNDLASVVEHMAGYISIDWSPAPMRTTDLREVYNQALQLLQYTRYGRILTDHQLMAPVLPNDQEWLVREWAPRAVYEAEYQRCAIVRSHNPYSRQATQEIVMQLASIPLTIGYFDDRNTAVSWLLV